MAPAIVYTILFGEDLGNDWERAELPLADSEYERIDDMLFSNAIGLLDKTRNTVHIHRAPNLSYTRSVIALDGTPLLMQWNDCLQLSFNHHQVFSDEQRRAYFWGTQGLRLRRLSENDRPYSSGKHVTSTWDAAKIEGITREHGRKPALISSKKAIRGKYKDYGIVTFEDDEFKPGKSDVSQMMWRGNLRGTNEFATERLGYVSGSAHYGDAYVEFWAALGGSPTTASDYRNLPGNSRTYSGYGSTIATHMKESQLVQDVLRFGRDGNGATVYIDTGIDSAMLPTETIETRHRRNGEKGLIRSLRDSPAHKWTTAGVESLPGVDFSPQHIRKLMNRLADEGHIRREKEGNGYVYYDDGIDEIDERMEIDLESPPTGAKHTPLKIHTWDFRSFDSAEPSTGVGSSPKSSEASVTDSISDTEEEAKK